MLAIKKRTSGRDLSVNDVIFYKEHTKSYQHGLPKTITTSLYLILNMNISGTLFFSPLLLSGISSIIKHSKFGIG